MFNIVFTCVGIQSVLVGLLAQKAEVKYDPTQISPEQIAAEVRDVGFDAEVIGREDENAEMDLLVGITPTGQKTNISIYPPP